MEDLEELSDWQLIEGCLKSDNRAWQLLHDRHHQTLRNIIWSHLREDRFDSHLVEDIAQMVWLTLLRNDYDVLRRYQRERSRLKTYLRDVGKQATEVHYRVKGRRLQAISLGGHEPEDHCPDSGLVLAQFAEYQASLTPQENRLLHEKIVNDVPERTQAPFSAGNTRWLKHRMKRKWGDHFGTT
jgi:DNA-directed RNA polymerase specialized sigma24 family protein